MGGKDFAAIEERLRAILARHVPPLLVTADRSGYFALSVDRTDIPEPRRFVGAARVGKSYVSFHLMPVYAFPELVKDISPELRKRMQGKSCFNFTRLDGTLLEELADLTDRGINRYREIKLPFNR